MLSLKKILILAPVILIACTKQPRPACNYCHTTMVKMQDHTAIPAGTKDTNICNDDGAVKEAYIKRNSGTVSYGSYSIETKTECQF